MYFEISHKCSQIEWLFKYLLTLHIASGLWRRRQLCFVNTYETHCWRRVGQGCLAAWIGSSGVMIELHIQIVGESGFDLKDTCWLSTEAVTKQFWFSHAPCALYGATGAYLSDERNANYSDCNMLTQGRRMDLRLRKLHNEEIYTVTSNQEKCEGNLSCNTLGGKQQMHLKFGR
jgi:hypothetical protein